jgi:hypothetical protein
MAERASRTQAGHRESVSRGQPSGGFVRSCDFSRGSSDHAAVNARRGPIRLAALNTAHAIPARPSRSSTSSRHSTSRSCASIPRGRTGPIGIGSYCRRGTAAWHSTRRLRSGREQSGPVLHDQLRLISALYHAPRFGACEVADEHGLAERGSYSSRIPERRRWRA